MTKFAPPCVVCGSRIVCGTCLKAERNEILIHLGATGYLATYQGPHAKRIADLFDSCTIPTAYTGAASLATVIAEIQQRNPGALVRHWVR